ncbi:MAG: ribonuclease P protein component [Verrucomicrobiales bacterium]|jgi:ribonuclease P protein component
MRLRSEFLRVRKQGRSYGGRYLVVAVLELEQLEEKSTQSKMGFIVSKRIGNAVARNFVKRRLHGIVGKIDADLQSQRYIVTIARKGAAEQTFATLQKEWHRLAKRAHLLLAPAFSLDSCKDAANKSFSDTEAPSATTH